MHRGVAQIAAWGVAERGVIDVPATEEEWADLVDQSQRERVLGSLLAAQASGALDIPEPHLGAAIERQRGALLWSLQVERRLLDVSAWFREVGGIEHLVLKGPVIAHLDEDDPSRRTFADLDLLVRGEDMDRAVAALTGVGGRRPWVQRRGGFDRRFAKSVTMSFADGPEVDLHRSLCDGAHGHRIPLGRIFEAADRVRVGGRDHACPSLVHRALHAAYHAVLGSPEPRPMSLRDLGRYLERDDLDAADVVAEARRWRGDAVVWVAVGEVAETLDSVPPAWRAWRDSFRPSDVELAVVARQRQEGSALGWAKVDALRELPSTKDRVAYATAIAWPSRAHLRSRHLRRRDLLGHPR